MEARGLSALPIRRLTVACRRYEKRPRVAVGGANLTRDFESIHQRQTEVEQDGVRPDRSAGGAQP